MPSWIRIRIPDPDPLTRLNPDPQPCLQVVGHVLDSINLDARERGRSIEFRDLYYVYVNEDPRHGMTYILDLLLVYKKFKGNKVTMKVRRHLYVRQPLLEPVVRPLSMEEFITPSGGPASAFQTFHSPCYSQCCGSGMGKRSRIRIWDEQPGSYFREL